MNWPAVRRKRRPGQKSFLTIPNQFSIKCICHLIDGRCLVAGLITLGVCSQISQQKCTPQRVNMQKLVQQQRYESWCVVCIAAWSCNIFPLVVIFFVDSCLPLCHSATRVNNLRQGELSLIVSRRMFVKSSLSWNSIWSPFSSASLTSDRTLLRSNSWFRVSTADSTLWLSWSLFKLCWVCISAKQ